MALVAPAAVCGRATDEASPQGTELSVGVVGHGVVGHGYRHVDEAIGCLTTGRDATPLVVGSWRRPRSSHVFVGIDVATAPWDMALLPTGERWAVSNHDAGIAALVTRLQEIAAQLMVLEATGTYQRAAVAALAAAGLPVAVVNPRQARGVAKATGQLATTDALDARALVHVAQAVRPMPRPLPDAQADELRARLARRQQLVAMRTAEQNRLGSVLPRLQPDIRAPITGLNTRLAALVGVAPLNRDRGTLRGHRTTWGGRAHVRATLSTSTLVAVRYHPVLKAFDERLRATAKAAKGLLALIFLFAGGMKLVLPLEVLTEQLPLPGLFMRFIGVAEVLGAIGLILPGLLRIRPGLTPLAAAGLVLIMSGPTVLTLALIPLVVGLLSAFVAYGCWRMPAAPGRA